MKKISIYLYMAMLMVVCSANTCTCGRKDVKPTYYLSQEAKDYTVFNTDSKWIYRTSNNQKVDTNIIIKKEIKLSFSRPLGYTAEIYNAEYKSTYYQDIVQLRTANMGLNDFFCTSSITYVSNIYSSRYSFLSGVDVGYFWDHGIITYTAQYPTYKIEDRTYENVKEFLYNGNNIDSRLPKRVWYARHVGIIKKELPNGEVWELISHQVTQ